MLRSKSRPEGVENGQNHHHSSRFSRTFSASKFCRGDSIGAQIDTRAHIKSNDKKPFKDSNSNSNLTENRIDAVGLMQQQIMETEDELRRTREELSASKSENKRVVEELRESRAMAGRANSREAMSMEKDESLMQEVESLRKMVSNKDKRIKFVEMELGKSRKVEVALAEKDESINRLNKELRESRDREKGSMVLVSENRRKIEEMEAEVKRRKDSESKMANSLAAKEREFENVEFELQEAKIELATLYEKIELLESLYNHNSGSLPGEGAAGDIDVVLKSARERENKAVSRVEAMQDEMELLKHEWKQALKAEQKSAKAMDDLALALAEVAAEAKQVKLKLRGTEVELVQARGEVERLKKMVKEAQQEAEVHKNRADRLRLEAEEMNLAWNGKEMGFVSCIKQAEEEKEAALLENARLAESLKAAENMTWSVREETYKSRDLLKQALNEASAAKAAAGLAIDENSQLKDALMEKEEMINFLTRENEHLRNSETAGHETIKELKRMVSTSASAEIKTDDKHQHEAAKSSDSSDDDHNKHDVDESKDKDKDPGEALTFNLDEFKVTNEPDEFELNVLDEDPEKAEALKGSIFDTSAVTPRSEPHTPKKPSSNQRRRRYSFSYTEVNENPNSESFYNSECDSTSENKQTHHRRVKTMFRRVGGLLAIKRGSSQRKEPAPSPLGSPPQKEPPAE